MRLQAHPLLLFIFLFFISTHNAVAADKSEVYFKELAVTGSTTHLLLFATIRNSKQVSLVQALHSGIPMHFTFFVELHQTKKNWPDKTINRMEFSHTLKYDALKEQYQIQTEEKENRKKQFCNLTDAMLAMNEINGLKVVNLAELTPGSTYVLRIKAELYEKTLPMNLHYIIPFISIWDLATKWHTIEFAY